MFDFSLLASKEPQNIGSDQPSFSFTCKKKFRKEYTKKNKKHQPNLFSRRLFAS